LLDILNSLLEFNPDSRTSAADLLKNPFFDGIRQPPSELPAPKQIVMKLDEEGVFDYKTNQDVKFGPEDYLRMLHEEIDFIRAFNPTFSHK
jgi:serine/threonine protein kinase